MMLEIHFITVALAAAGLTAWKCIFSYNLWLLALKTDALSFLFLVALSTQWHTGEFFFLNEKDEDVN